MSATWTIVKFISDNSVEAVPTSWVADGKCAWPNYTRERIMKAIRTCEPPISSWNHHEIKPFRNATYNNYATARQKSMRAEETSDLNSDCDKAAKRVSKRTKTFSADSDYEQSDDSSSDKHTTDVDEIIPEFPQIEIQRADKIEHELPNNLGASRSSTVEKELSGSIFNGAIEKCTCCAIHKQEAANNNGFLKQIIRKLTIMEMDICDIRKILDRTPVTTQATENVWGEFDIPFTNLEGLTSFEEYLSNEENMKKSVTELSRIGGDNANEFIKRAMSKLITHKLAAEFSWVGLKKKKIFSTMNISNLLIRSGQQNGKTSASTVKEMEDGIKKFLRRAAERAIAEEKRLAIRQ